MTNEKYVSIAEAARRLSVARGTVYSWIANGSLETIIHAANGRTLISVSSIETLSMIRDKNYMKHLEDSEKALEPAKKITYTYLTKIVKKVKAMHENGGSFEEIDLEDQLLEYISEAVETALAYPIENLK